MFVLLKFSRFIDKSCQCFGNLLSWSWLFLMLLMVSIVAFRYIFSIGSIAAQELVTYIHATIFMLGGAYALKNDAHVRVDILYRNLSKKKQALINLFGSLFLLMPTMVFIVYISWDYVSRSWVIFETSAEAGGIHFVYGLKSLIILMALLLITQALSESIKNLAVILNIKTDSNKKAVEHNL